MSKILIVPDVHGRVFWRKAKELINDVDKVIFLGDYLDPYPYEEITREQAIEQFEDIVQFKKDHLEKVTLLLGNHDCAYCYNFGSASRYDYENETLIKKLFNDNISLFELCKLIDNYLFSHAGITNYWLQEECNCKNINQFLNLSFGEIRSYLWIISWLRGGDADTGSIIWSDVRERDREDTYYQIFGHTQLHSEPLITDKYACLDVRQLFLLNTETKEMLEVNE